VGVPATNSVCSLPLKGGGLGWGSALTLAVLTTFCLSRPAAAAYPERTIRLVVAYPAGGTGDLVGRIVADALSARLGVSVVVENQSGASGAIAAATVARAPADGYTILLGGNAIFAILPHVTKVNYDGVKDFTAIANLSESLRVLAVSPAVPAKTLPEFVDHARRNRGKLNFGSAGIGSTLHIMTEIFQREAGFEAVHVPFRGSTPAVQALLRGDIDFLIDTVVIPYVEQGTLRGLAAVSDRRLPTLPDLPTLLELGYPNVRTSGWQALLGPAGMSPEAVATLNRHLAEIFNDGAFLDRLAKVGVWPRYRASSALGQDLREDDGYFGGIIRRYRIGGQ
jgi:tripartite-type tricarboxylate transporter receptor subunit TctC